MLNPKKSAKYYLKKANYNREEAKELVYKQVERVRKQHNFIITFIILCCQMLE